MFDFPPNAKAFLVSRKTMDISSKDWLWHCYLQFKNQVKAKWDDDLVFMWREDFNELYDNYHPKPKDMK